MNSDKSVKIRGKGNSPNSKSALKSYKKGESGNPKGRPKGSLSLKERMQKYLDLDIKIKMPDGSIQNKSMLDSIVLSLFNQAQKGNIRAIQEVLDRGYGKETANLNVTFSHEKALEELK